MTTTEWKDMATDVKNRTLAAANDEFTLTKLNFCLIGAICFLAGICIGMLAAPLSQGVHVLSHNVNNGSGNGSKNGNNHGNQYGDDEEGGKS